MSEGGSGFDPARRAARFDWADLPTPMLPLRPPSTVRLSQSGTCLRAPGGNCPHFRCGHRRVRASRVPCVRAGERVFGADQVLSLENGDVSCARMVNRPVSSSKSTMTGVVKAGRRDFFMVRGMPAKTSDTQDHLHFLRIARGRQVNREESSVNVANWLERTFVRGPLLTQGEPVTKRVGHVRLVIEKARLLPSVVVC